MIDLPNPTSSATAALAMIGLNASGIEPSIEAPLAHRWRNQTLNGIKFKDVAAHRLDRNNSNFTTVQVAIK